MSDCPCKRVKLRVRERRVEDFDDMETSRSEQHVCQAGAVKAEKDRRLLHQGNLSSEVELLHENALETESAQRSPALLLVHESAPRRLPSADEDPSARHSLRIDSDSRSQVN